MGIMRMCVGLPLRGAERTSGRSRRIGRHPSPRACGVSLATPTMAPVTPVGLDLASLWRGSRQAVPACSELRHHYPSPQVTRSHSAFTAVRTFMFAARRAGHTAASTPTTPANATNSAMRFQGMSIS